MQCYVSEHSLPYYVNKALEDGYHISHKGLLCRSPIPARPLQPTVRTFFILLEAAFAFIFWAMYATKGDYGMSSICPWDRAALEYSGLCSHCCLNEQVPGEWGFSDEELELLDKLRKAQRKKSNQDSVDRIREKKTYWCDLWQGCQGFTVQTRRALHYSFASTQSSGYGRPQEASQVPTLQHEFP